MLSLALELYGPEGVKSPEDTIASSWRKCQPRFIGSTYMSVMLPFVAAPQFCIDCSANEPRFRLSMGSRLPAPLASAIPNGTSTSNPYVTPKILYGEVQ